MSLRRSRDGRRNNVLLAALVLAAALVLPTPAILGQDIDAEDPDEDTGGTEADTVEEADVQKSAYYTRRTDESTPPALTDEFPPGVVCLLFPQLCTEDVEPITGPIDERVQEAEIPAGPVQPVPDDSLPAGLTFGQERYFATLDFVLPEPPEDKTFTQFELVLHEEVSQFAVESPGFRAAVRAVIAQAADDPSPEPFIDALQQIAEGEEPLVDDDTPGVEACAVVEAWDEGDNQEAEDAPERDCLVGGSGVEDDGTWVFDLTFAAQAWVAGEVEFHGIMLAPELPANLEFGDPDYSTNMVAAFVSGTGEDPDPEQLPEIRYTFGEDPGLFDDPEDGDEIMLPDPGADASGASVETGDFDSGAASPSAPSSAPDTGGMDPGGDEFSADDPGIDEASGEDAADGDGVETPQAAAAEEQPAGSQGPVPSEPWYLWMLLPAAVGGFWWYGRVLDFEPEMALEREGALSRLMSGE